MLTEKKNIQLLLATSLGCRRSPATRHRIGRVEEGVRMILFSQGEVIDVFECFDKGAFST